MANDDQIRVSELPEAQSKQGLYVLGVDSQDRSVKFQAALLDGEDGTDGVGIASVVQTATSQESGGTNVVRITLTDNTYVDVEIKNGAAVGSVTVNQTTGESTSATMSQKAITDHVKKIPVLLHDYTHTAERLYATAVEQVTENNETFWKYTFDPSTAPSWMPEVGSDVPVTLNYNTDYFDNDSVVSASKVPKWAEDVCGAYNLLAVQRIDSTHFKLTARGMSSFYMAADVNLGSFFLTNRPVPGEGTYTKTFDVTGWKKIKVVASKIRNVWSRYQIFPGLVSAYPHGDVNLVSVPAAFRNYIHRNLIYADSEATLELTIDGDDKIGSTKVVEAKNMEAYFDNNTTSNTNKTVLTSYCLDGDINSLGSSGWRCPSNAAVFRFNIDALLDGSNIKIYGLEKFE